MELWCFSNANKQNLYILSQPCNTYTHPPNFSLCNLPALVYLLAVALEALCVWGHHDNYKAPSGLITFVLLTSVRILSYHCCGIISAHLNNGIVVTTPLFILNLSMKWYQIPPAEKVILWSLFCAPFVGIHGWSVLGASSWQCWKVIKAKLEVFFKSIYSLCQTGRT